MRAGNRTIDISFGWIEMPIFPEHAVRSVQQNKLVREVNYLNSNENPPCRSWRSCLTDVEAVKSKLVEVSGLSGLFYDPLMYGTGTREHWDHLSDRGNAAFL